MLRLLRLYSIVANCIISLYSVQGLRNMLVFSAIRGGGAYHTIVANHLQRFVVVARSQRGGGHNAADVTTRSVTTRSHNDVVATFYRL